MQYYNIYKKEERRKKEEFYPRLFPREANF